MVCRSGKSADQGALTADDFVRLRLRLRRRRRRRRRRPRRRDLSGGVHWGELRCYRRANMRHLLSRRLSVRASSSGLPLLRLPTVLFPSQPLSLRLTPSDAEGVDDPLSFEAPEMTAPAELVSRAWRDFDGKVVAVGPCGNAACRMCPCLAVSKRAAPVAWKATLRVSAALRTPRPQLPLRTPRPRRRRASPLDRPGVR